MAKRKPTTPPKPPVVDMSSDPVSDDEILIPDDVLESTGARVMLDANGDQQIIPDVSGDLPEHMDLKRRQRVSLALRLTGANYSDIANATKVSERQAKRDVAKAFEEMDRDDVRIQRAIHHQRLETLLMRNWANALQSDQAATNNVLAIMDRIDRLFNLSGGEFEEERHEDDGSFIIAENTSSAEYMDILHNARKALTKGKGS